MNTIVLPSSINHFQPEYVNLTDVYCYSSIPPSVNGNRFSSQSNIKNGTLYVPKGCSQEYWKAEGWREFKNIRETLDICYTLTIHVSENGTVKYKGETIAQTYPIYYAGYRTFEVPSFESIDVEIIPNDGFSVSSVKIDGRQIDVSQSSTMLSLGELNNHSILEVSFEESSSIAYIKSDFNENIKVYNLQGILIVILDKIEEIHKLPKGLYILKSGQNTEKVFLH